MSAARRQTQGEEIANTVTHVVGSHLGAAMLALVVWTGAASGTDVAWKVTSGAIFGASMILLYAVSSAYHAVTNERAKAVLHIMDHMAIYFLIAGSYTPFCLVVLRPDHPILAWTIFGVEWGAADDRALPLHFDERIRPHGLGGACGDSAARPLAARSGHDVARDRRRTLHPGLCLLSVEVASLLPHDMASLRPCGHDLPLLLHPLVRDVLIPADVKTMWCRFSRRADEIRFGIYACSPDDSSFTAVFVRGLFPAVAFR